jgi:hypothetical protein
MSVALVTGWVLFFAASVALCVIGLPKVGLACSGVALVLAFLMSLSGRTRS